MGLLSRMTQKLQRAEEKVAEAIKDIDLVNDTARAPVIHVENLTIRYGSVVAIKNANFLAEAGQVLALVGPSGCGKSSLLSAINRMTDSMTDCLVEGKVLLNEKNILDRQVNIDLVRRQVGMVFQQANPFPLSIADNILFPLKDHGMRNKTERDDLMREVLEKTGLWEEVKHRLKHSALKLSGGQQQRLCIARALALKPSALLLDEPCSALDPVSTEKIEALIHDMKGQVSMIMVTHNLAQARRIADQVAVCWLDQGCGCVIECDNTQNIFERPVHPVTKDYCLGRMG